MTKPTEQTSARGISRRQILKATAGTVALLAAAKLNFPAGAFALSAAPLGHAPSRPETRQSA